MAHLRPFCRRPAVRPCRAARVQRLTAHAVGGSSKAELESLAREILVVEGRLKSAFQSGQRMPTGAEVANMRTRAKTLRAELREKVEALGGEHAEISANKEIASLISAVAAQRARESLSSVADQLAAGASFDGPMDDLSDEEMLQLEMLQLENEELRERASSLLMRQAYLEELMVENGLEIPGGYTMSSMSSSDSEDETPYYMSSPSYY